MKIRTSNPKRTAYNYVYSVDNLYRQKPPRLDMRFNSSRETLKLIKKLQISEPEKKRIITLKKERSGNRIEKFTNVLSNPIVRDYGANNGYLTGVFSDHLQFGGRNHWAKNSTDLKVLAILKRNYLTK